MTDGAPDFFISYTQADGHWAAWIRHVLEVYGYSTLSQAADFEPGEDFLYRMQRATIESSRTLAVLSPQYVRSEFGGLEWRAALAQDPSGERRLLIPVRIEECEPPGLLRTRIHVDLVGLDEDAAQQTLLRGVAGAPCSGSSASGTAAHGATTSTSAPRSARAPFPGAARASSPRSGPAPAMARSDEPAQAGPSGQRRESRWRRLSRDRPSLAALVGEHFDLIGHRELKELLRARLHHSETATVVVLAGPDGSGKSAALAWLRRTAGARVVEATGATPDPPLREDGKDVGRLLRRLEDQVEATADNAVLVYDDVDHDLREEGIRRLVVEAMAQLKLGFVVLCASAPLPPDLLPTAATQYVLDRRRATRQHFDAFLDRVLTAAGQPLDAFSPDLRRGLHEMAEATPDFEAVKYVVEMLLAHQEAKGRTTRLVTLRSLLDAVQVHQPQLPDVRVQKGGRLAFVRREKSALLAQVLVDHLGTADALVQRAEQRGLSAFDADSFLQEAEEHSYWRSVVALCLTSSPRELVIRLLEEREVRQEVDLRGLDPRGLLTSEQEQADRLVRALGFTVVDAPKGLRALEEALEDAQRLTADQEARTDVVRGAGAKVLEQLEAALLALLNFWAVYLYRSLRDLVMTYNAQPHEGDAIDVWRLTHEQVLALLKFVAADARSNDSVYRLSFPQGEAPVSPALLDLADACLDARRAFESVPALSAPEAPIDRTSRLRCAELLDAAADLLGEARRAAERNVYPAPIKITEIVFDEYGRRLFRGVDSQDRYVRFALTDKEESDELVVAAHYLMLPHRRISVDPHIVPAGLNMAPVMFDRAQDYERASSTQRAQGHRLLELVDLSSNDVAIEVGCGTGALALEAARRARRVLGIDQSMNMVRRAEVNAQRAGVRNVTFECADLVNFSAEDRYDVVLSNSAMHWILPPLPAYQCLLGLLRPRGRLGVHQGGHGTYRGLHEHAVSTLGALDLLDVLDDFTYEVYYPTVDDYRDLLQQAGFDDIEIISKVSDGLEYPDLVRDFSEAGLLPYLDRVPRVRREEFRYAFLERAEHADLDLHTHRLYATARRP